MSSERRQTQAAAAEQAAQHWNKVTTSRQPPRDRWWLVPEVVQHVNQRVCGEALPGFGAGLRHWLKETVPELPLRRGIAIGAGNGAKEMDLIADGIVEHVDVYEVATARVDQGRAMAVDRGLADRISFHTRLLSTDEDIGSYDLVHWNNALHHMLDVDEWLAWSRRVLAPGGVLLMDDFVGADRFQWSKAQLRYASKYRRTLPKKLLRDPADPSQHLPRRVTRPTIEDMLAADPTEAADSSRIIPSLHRHFPEAQVKFTGGVIHQLALTDVIANFDPVEHRFLLRQALLMDDLISEMGENHYAVAIARAPQRLGRRTQERLVGLARDRRRFRAGVERRARRLRDAPLGTLRRT